METTIRQSLRDPEQLEALYRSQPDLFSKTIDLLYQEQPDDLVIRTWQARLHYVPARPTDERTTASFPLILVLSLLAFLYAKLPKLVGLEEDEFYLRNLGFIVFPFISVWFIYKNKLRIQPTLILVIATVLLLIYNNLLGQHRSNGTIELIFIHLPLLLWSLVGFSYTANEPRSLAKRISYLKYNGDLVVLTTLILLAGGLLTGLTMALFSIIHFNIENFYFNYIVIWGLCAAPLFASYFTQQNPLLVGKVSPLIAKLFTPLVLFTLLMFLPASIISGSDPYNDRNYLLLFNVLLIAVMALILFSVVETSREVNKTPTVGILFTLALVTILVNSIALSAILFRISEWGFTPNRLAVLGGNVLILLHLAQVGYHLFKVMKGTATISSVENSIARYLPVYPIWTLVVLFVFPLIFGFN